MPTIKRRQRLRTCWWSQAVIIIPCDFFSKQLFLRRWNASKQQKLISFKRDAFVANRHTFTRLIFVDCIPLKILRKFSGCSRMRLLINACTEEPNTVPQDTCVSKTIDLSPCNTVITFGYGITAEITINASHENHHNNERGSIFFIRTPQLED